MSHSGAATFKKVAGIITINEDASPAELTWRSTSGDKTHTIVLDTIDKLQATPATSDKMILRLMSKVDESKKQKDNDGNEVLPKPQIFMFSFNNRTVMDNIKITLQQIISRYKDNEIYEEKRRKESSEQPQSQQQQQHLSDVSLINTESLDDSLSEKKLRTNLKLQQSLLKSNKTLMKTFQETVINSGLPPNEFWSTRVSLLRAFALSTSQKIGPYNVLSTIKPVASSENKVNVNLSKERILSIFQNYPIVKKAYSDNVPKNFKEQEFWARFFSSKLFRKLRGEKIMQNDRGDVIIDRYLTLDQEYDRMDDEKLLHPVKKFIDIDGNVQDDPVRQGNKPDFTMQAGIDVNGNNDGTVDILKGMNRLSEKMIMALENEYSRNSLQDQESPDTEEKESLEIMDLQNAFKAEYAMIHLKKKDMKRTENTTAATSQKSSTLSITKAKASSEIANTINGLKGHFDLTKVTPDSQTNTEINQRVIAAVKINAKQAKHNNLDPLLGGFIGNTNNSDATEASSDLPFELLESCRILHGTCCEFLKHFYIHFQSAEYKQAVTVNKLYKHLKDCIDKLNELFNDVKTQDGEEMATMCVAYLKPVFDSISLAVSKYDEAFLEQNKRDATPV
ncbi:hypothetical protein KAFR_0D04620 [Kazachstania africana CBS 2517]|uniref:BSD domain-containing protein n=1 Tax=Kazachstania africana (strain ATCC 22294 / BCRC 22015 / CBS 2517 / CECT 1963 / NBRC 1671 / NRRL Y-8276) TaxID=1071382 RepID=H2AUR0_KAZAF|nr:hypothetical protein KAFR_0D04620 [Kazachstania africana CBS 2517]CCF58110.1 hypothetical protein KAFR_0D04620 [Kazachstania africana CBS 2517]